MVYPVAMIDRLKYVAWSFYTPYHPVIRNTLVSLRIISHDIRQPFRLGTLAPGRSADDFVSFLISKGYGNHFIAWKDKGEVIGLRRVENFFYQYHIRLFEDGEVRGHYEYTPESYPILHLQEIGMEDRTLEFRELMKGWIVR